MSHAPNAKAFMVVGPFILTAATIVAFFIFAGFILTSPVIDLKDAIVASIVTLALRELIGIITIMVSHIYPLGKPHIEDKDGDGVPDA